MVEANSDWFLHAESGDDLTRLGKGQWTVLWEQSRSENESIGRYSALASPERRDRVMRDYGWDLLIGDYSPGFSVSHENGTREVQYEKGFYEGLEPLVRVRDFHGIKPWYVELSEEFRLFHNLWEDGSGRFYAIDDAGNDAMVAEVSNTLARVHTRLLRQYQAARQLDLILFAEIDRYADSVPDGAEGYVRDFESDQLRAQAFVSPHAIGERRLCRFMGKQLVSAPPMESCGVWPFDEPDDHFPAFPIGVDENGGVIKHTCNPEELANYFGKNPDSPHYLTPVFFRRDVLNRYYQQPERYSIVDGHLSCAGLWMLRMDNDHADQVMVFLGDLGRDLPASERDYWLPFALAEERHMSETAFRRGFLGQFADPTVVDIVFRNTYCEFSEAWKNEFGWEFFREPRDGDKHVLSGVRLPATSSAPEIEAQLINLTRLLVDSLNDAELKTRISADIKEAKSIQKLKLWLEQENYPHFERDITLLRNLQDARSKGAAHRKGSDYETFLVSTFGTKESDAIIGSVLRRSLVMMKDLASYFGLEIEDDSMVGSG